MLHRMLFSLGTLLFLGAFLTAAEYVGTIEKINTKTGAMTIKMKDDKMKDFDVSFRAKVLDQDGKDSTGKKRLAIFTKDASQAIDRAHRIGQERPVFACRLIARDTVEEKVLDLQKKKRELADAIINADNSLIRDLSRDDLEMLLS